MFIKEERHGRIMRRGERYFWDYRIMDRDLENNISVIRYKVYELWSGEKVNRIAVPCGSNYNIDLSSFQPLITVAYCDSNGKITNPIDATFFYGAFKKATLQRCGTCIAMTIQPGEETRWEAQLNSIINYSIPEEEFPKDWGDYTYSDIDE